MRLDPDHLVTDPDALQALYGEPGEASLKKEVDHVHPHYRAFIEASPFAMLATAGPDGLDASPRGDPAGFVVVEDEKPCCCPTGAATTASTACATSWPTHASPCCSWCRAWARRCASTAWAASAPIRRCWNASAWTASCRARCWWSKCRRCISSARARCCARACGTRLPRCRAAPPSAGRILSDLTAGTFDGVAYDRDLPARVAKTLY